MSMLCKHGTRSYNWQASHYLDKDKPHSVPTTKGLHFANHRYPMFRLLLKSGEKNEKTALNFSIMESQHFPIIALLLRKHLGMLSK